jgi:glutamate/tyrosine decarboxylase-like PLP-dependent enzyme
LPAPRAGAADSFLKPVAIEPPAPVGRNQAERFVCTGGTTNAGLLEPVEPFVREASGCGAWVHLDGAHGAFCALSSDKPENYWARADSVSWDPHKTLFATYPAGLLLLRDRAQLRTLEHRPDYAFQDKRLQHPAFAHMEGSRGLDALKVWMIIRHFGREGLRSLTDHLLGLAAYLSRRVAADPSLELVSPAETNIVCFRWSAAPETQLDTINDALQQALYEEGQFLLSRTRIGGRTVLRAVLQNPHTREADIDAMLSAVRTRAEASLSCLSVQESEGRLRRVS